MSQPRATTELAIGDSEIVVVPDPHRLGRDRVRLEPYGIPVWALIAHLQGVEWDAAQAAADYGIPEFAVSVAIDHYRAEPQYIDAFLLLNRSTFDEVEGDSVVSLSDRGRG